MAKPQKVCFSLVFKNLVFETKYKLFVKKEIEKISNPCFQYFYTTDIDYASCSKYHIILIFGGDGTFLHTIHNYPKLKFFFLLPLGHQNFFSLAKTNFDEQYKKLVTFLSKISTFDEIKKKMILLPCLKLTINNNKYHAFNEMKFFNKSYQTVKMECQIDNDYLPLHASNKYCKELHLCGSIFSIVTPWGSSGFLQSIDGPIVYNPLYLNNVFIFNSFLKANFPLQKNTTSIPTNILFDKHTQLALRAINNCLLHLDNQELIEFKSNQKMTVNFIQTDVGIIYPE